MSTVFDRWRHAGAWLWTGLVLAYLIVPLLVIVPMSLTSGTMLTLPTPGWSLRWYKSC